MTDELHYGTVNEMRKIDHLTDLVIKQEAVIREIQEKLKELEDVIKGMGEEWKR